MKSKIIEIFKTNGPLTGWQLLEKSGYEPLQLWQICRQSEEICFEKIGRQYLRLDKAVEGYARLSPSIRREFLTYTVLGLEIQSEEIKQKAQSLQEEVHRIGRAKFDLARESMASVVGSLPGLGIEEHLCFIMAGDVTYDMAHAVPRPEISTGKMVRGSDLDIVVIAEDDVPQEELKVLDSAILKKKYYLLVHPNYQEEIDYLVKNIAKVRLQLAFDSFQHMIASKIMHESVFLYGSEMVFQKVKNMVEEYGVFDKLTALEKQARKNRNEAEASLLHSDNNQMDKGFHHLFYTSEEKDEIY
jgi:hypothetical protein